MFRKGQFFVEAGGGATSTAPLPEDYFGFYYIYMAQWLNSPYSQIQHLALMNLIMDYGRPLSLEGKSSNFSMEYALTDKFGIGGSIRSSNLTLKNVSLRHLDPYFFFIPYAMYVDDFLTLNLIRYDEPARPIMFMDFDMAFHIQAKSFDPYVKLSMGSEMTSSADGSYFSKARLALGGRFSPFENTHLFLEAYTSSLELNDAEGETISTEPTEISGFLFGVGIALDPP